MLKKYIQSIFLYEDSATSDINYFKTILNPLPCVIVSRIPIIKKFKLGVVITNVIEGAELTANFVKLGEKTNFDEKLFNEVPKEAFKETGNTHMLFEFDITAEILEVGNYSMEVEVWDEGAVIEQSKILVPVKLELSDE